VMRLMSTTTCIHGNVVLGYVGVRSGGLRKKWKRDGVETTPYQLAQEFYCSCRGHPEANVKTCSSKTNCRAMLRLHRTEDNGWVVVEHISEHNHPLSETYGEKKNWPSHHHLDKFTKDLIRMLRENNIGITKLYSILGNFFGSMQNVPATKRCLKTVSWWDSSTGAATRLVKSPSLFLFPFCVAYLVYLSRFVTRRGSL